MPLKKLTICVAGGGSWGTALAHMAASRGHATTMFMRRAEVCYAVNNLHENPAYLPGLRINKAVKASTDPSVLNAECVILAVPCQQQRAFPAGEDLDLHGAPVAAPQGGAYQSLCLRCPRPAGDLQRQTARFLPHVVLPVFSPLYSAARRWNSEKIWQNPSRRDILWQKREQERFAY